MLDDQGSWTQTLTAPNLAAHKWLGGRHNWDSSKKNRAFGCFEAIAHDVQGSRYWWHVSVVGLLPVTVFIPPTRDVPDLPRFKLAMQTL
jgi:hypothetical protein